MLTAVASHALCPLCSTPQTMFAPGEIPMDIEHRVPGYEIPGDDTTYIDIYFDVPQDEPKYHVTGF